MHTRGGSVSTPECVTDVVAFTAWQSRIPMRARVRERERECVCVCVCRTSADVMTPKVPVTRGLKGTTCRRPRQRSICVDPCARVTYLFWSAAFFASTSALSSFFSLSSLSAFEMCESYASIGRQRSQCRAYIHAETHRSDGNERQHREIIIIFAYVRG